MRLNLILFDFTNATPTRAVIPCDTVFRRRDTAQYENTRGDRTITVIVFFYEQKNFFF